MLGSQGDNGCVTAEESEGRAQECRNPHFGEKVKNKSAQTREKESGTHRKTCDYRDQNCGSEHGEHVLETEGKHLALPKGTGIIDTLLRFCHKYKGLLSIVLPYRPIMTVQR